MCCPYCDNVLSVRGVQMSRKNTLNWRMKFQVVVGMEAVYYSKKLVCTYQTIDCHMQEIICMHEPFLKFVEKFLDLYFGQ